MTALEYARTVMVLLLIAFGLGVGARRLRRRLLAEWNGPEALLAEVVLVLGALMIVLEGLGIAGFLRPLPTLLASLFAGGAMAAAGVGPRARNRPRQIGASAPALIAAAVALFVLLQWTDPALRSLDRGVTDGDSLWYHLPFAAGFAQQGSITALHYTGTSYLSWFYPANGELFHAFAMVAAGNHDILSPVLSIAWLGLAFLAAYSVGRSFGAGPACVAAVALLLGSRLIVEREPGAARTDIAGVAFLLCSAAILIRGWAPRRELTAGVLIVAGLAAGLAAGTRLTLLPPVAVLSVGVVVLSSRKPRALGLWLLPLLATGSFWYARNLIASGNPLPWLKLGFGPVVLAGAVPDRAADQRFSVAHYWHDVAVWRNYFAPGLHDALGPLWPLIVALAAAGVILAVARGSGVIRLLGLAAAVATVAYLVNPLGAPGPEGAPATFESNLRYAAPALALGLVLFPCLLPARARRSVGLLAGLSAVLLIGGEQVDLSSPNLLGELAVVALCLGSGLTVLVGPRRPASRAAVAIACVVGFALIAWPTLRHYANQSYGGATSSKVEGPRLGTVYRWAQGVTNTNIATTSILQYGLYGDHLSNQVSYLGVHADDGSFSAPSTCLQLRKALDRGHFDYFVLAPEYEQDRAAVPIGWLRSPNASQILRAGPTRVFRLDGRLPGHSCPRSEPAPTERLAAMP